MFKSELAKLAGVSSRTFRRYLATRRPILTAMGVSPFARKLPPQAVHYISEDYCIDIPPCLKWLMSHFNINTHRVSRDAKTHRESSVSATLCLHPPLNSWSSKRHQARLFGRVVTRVNDVKGALGVAPLF